MFCQLKMLHMTMLILGGVTICAIAYFYKQLYSLPHGTEQFESNIRGILLHRQHTYEGKMEDPSTFTPSQVTSDHLMTANFSETSLFLSAVVHPESNRPVKDFGSNDIAPVGTSSSSLDVWPTASKAGAPPPSWAWSNLASHTIDFGPSIIKGYVFVVRYWEQMASSASTMMSLQCWAGRLAPPMFVVQPHYHDGWLRTFPLFGAPMLFSDLFDVNRWNNVSLNSYYAPIVHHLQFKKFAVRNLVVVNIIHWKLLNIGTGLDKASRLTSGCSKSDFEVPGGHLLARFVVVRRACINLSYGDVLTPEEFNALVFGNYSSGEVSVAFMEWRGISGRNKFRTILNGSDCEWHHVPIRHAWSPSAKVKKAASLYSSQFLGVGDYVAVMVRMEWAVFGHNRTYLEDLLQRRVMEVLGNMREHASTNVTFLSADVGRFGSGTMEQDVEMASVLRLAFSSFFERVYGGRLPLWQWEESFELVTLNADRSFVAMVQATIVAHARCAIFVGFGNFQKYTKYVFDELHGNEVAPCVDHIR